MREKIHKHSPLGKREREGEVHHRYPVHPLPDWDARANAHTCSLLIRVRVRFANKGLLEECCMKNLSAEIHTWGKTLGSVMEIGESSLPGCPQVMTVKP